MTAQDKTKSYSIEESNNPALEAGKYINDIFSTNIGKPILFLIGGGSSLEVLDYILPEFIPENLTVTVTDERFTAEMDENNFDILQTTKFYSQISEVESFCINTAVFAGDEVETHAKRFESNIKAWIKDYPEGKIVALYGIGEDGHTAGIIPNIYDDKEFDEKFMSDCLVSTTVDKSGKSQFPERVTTTLSFMEKVHFPIFFLKGESKRKALELVLDNNTKIQDIPAHMLTKLKHAVVFTDIKL